MSDSNKICSHLLERGLFTAYLDSELEGVAEREFLDHLSQCDRCAHALEEMASIHQTLLGDHDLFHPDGEDIYRVATRRNVDYYVRKHIERCPSCQEEVAAISEYLDREYQLSASLEREGTVHNGLERITQALHAIAIHIRGLIRTIKGFPSLSLGTAFAILIIAVMLYPWLTNMPDEPQQQPYGPHGFSLKDKAPAPSSASEPQEGLPVFEEARVKESDQTSPLKPETGMAKTAPPPSPAPSISPRDPAGDRELRANEKFLTTPEPERSMGYGAGEAVEDQIDGTTKRRLTRGSASSQRPSIQAEEQSQDSAAGPPAPLPGKRKARRHEAESKRGVPEIIRVRVIGPEGAPLDPDKLSPPREMREDYKLRSRPWSWDKSDDVDAPGGRQDSPGRQKSREGVYRGLNILIKVKRQGALFSLHGTLKRKNRLISRVQRDSVSVDDLQGRLADAIESLMKNL